jgi:hypothetical protein
MLEAIAGDVAPSRKGPRRVRLQESKMFDFRCLGGTCDENSDGIMTERGTVG